MPQLGPTRRHKAVACAVGLFTMLGAIFQDIAPTSVHPARMLLAGAFLGGLAALAALWPGKKRSSVVSSTTFLTAECNKKKLLDVPFQGLKGRLRPNSSASW